MQRLSLAHPDRRLQRPPHVTSNAGLLRRVGDLNPALDREPAMALQPFKPPARTGATDASPRSPSWTVPSPANRRQTTRGLAGAADLPLVRRAIQTVPHPATDVH